MNETLHSRLETHVARIDKTLRALEHLADVMTDALEDLGIDLTGVKDSLGMADAQLELPLPVPEDADVANGRKGA